MRVLSVVKSLGLGGTERVAKNYAALYHEIGYESAILSFSDNYSPLAWLDKYKIPFFFKLESNGKAKNKKVIDALLSYAPDIVHIHNNGLQKKDLLDWLPLLTPRPLVLETCHFPLIADYFDYVDIHLQLSHWCLWQFYCALKYERKDSHKKIYILPHVVDSSAFFSSSKPLEKDRIRKELKLPERAFIFGYIGQSLYDKWSWLLLSAFEEMIKEGCEAHLLLVGIPQVYRNYINRLSPDIHMRITMMDTVKDQILLKQLYQSMDTFLYASHLGETFGMVFTEAMLCRVPVISLFTPYRGNSQLEVTGFGRGGLVVSNKRSMKKAMKLFMKDKKKCKEIGGQGREWVLEQYSPVPLGERLQNIIREGLDRSASQAERIGCSTSYADACKEVRRQNENSVRMEVCTPSAYAFFNCKASRRL